MPLSPEPSSRRLDYTDSRPLSPLEEDVPPPFYSDKYGQMDIHHIGFGTNARVVDDGRIDVNITEKKRKLSNMLGPTLQPSEELEKRPSIPASLLGAGKGPVPRMNIVIQTVGSRGDVQPFVALGQVLKNECGHRVRIATHPVFRDFVEEHGLEFFSIGVDPTVLMAFMVRNPGLMPGLESLKNGDVGKRRKDIAEIISGCWRSCFEAGDGTGTPVADLDSVTRCMGDAQPFVADAIIANPPSFAHIHCAEKLGIPLHLMFTMPWSPTQAFPHPLVNIQFSNAEKGVANFVSYALVEMLTWQGLGDIINRFRARSLGLEPISVMWGPGMIPRLKVPYTYCWSPMLLPKPRDWGPQIDISGYFFLKSASNYSPPPDLAQFLAAGPPPVYIGFGSIVIDNPDEMTRLIFKAVKESGQRALISKGWGGIGAEKLGVPEGVFMMGSCPHDWLFPKVSCVVHHGGAGTTAIGIACGKPTIIVPFFGDQPFWGSIVFKAGAGPRPIPHKQLTVEGLTAAITSALEPEMQLKAKELGDEIRKEPSLERGVESFNKQLRPETVRCMLSPGKAAAWRVKDTKIRLSAFAVAILTNEGILDVRDLKLYRPREYDLEPGPRDPISGGAAALLESLVDFTIGFADIPASILRPIPRLHRRIRSRQRRRSTSPAIPLQSRSTSRGSHDERPVSCDRERFNHHRKRSGSRKRLHLPIHTIRRKTEADLGHAKEEDGASIASSDSKASSYKEAATQVSKVTAEEVIGAGRAATKMVTAGIMSPLNFALGVAKGFHNAPKLYGDDTVREQEKVTGFESGLRAGGKAFGYGIYDGITGLVTQPLRGRKEGPKGVIKGIGKGVGGLILKPGAGVFGLAGYPLSGIHKEFQKLLGTSVECYIMACRTKQGYDEWNESTKEERQEVLDGWYCLGADLESKALRSPFAAEWEAISRILFDPTRRHELRHETGAVTAEPSGIEKLAPDNFREAIRSATHLISSLVNRYKVEPEALDKRQTQFGEQHAELESPEDEEQCQMIERALHASIAELDEAQACGDHRHAGDRALQACVNEARRAQEEREAKKKTSSHTDTKPNHRRFTFHHGEARGRMRENEPRHTEKRKLTKEGLDAVAEFAIWKTLTDHRKPAGSQQDSPTETLSKIEESAEDGEMH